MKMKDFFNAYDCFFSTINNISIYVIDYNGGREITMSDCEMVDMICHIDKWFWKNYIIECFNIDNHTLHIDCIEY